MRRRHALSPAVGRLAWQHPGVAGLPTMPPAGPATTRCRARDEQRCGGSARRSATPRSPRSSPPACTPHRRSPRKRRTAATRPPCGASSRPRARNSTCCEPRRRRALPAPGHPRRHPERDRLRRRRDRGPGLRLRRARVPAPPTARASGCRRRPSRCRARARRRCARRGLGPARPSGPPPPSWRQPSGSPPPARGS